MQQQMIAREKSRAPPLNWEESQAWVLENLAYSPAHSVSFTFVTFMLARIANEVAPMPSTAPRPSSSSSKHGKTQESNESADKQSEPAELQSPTPASAAAFISGGTFRRKNRSTSTSTTTTTTDPVATKPSAVRRQAVEAALSSIFARVLISASASMPSKEKERRASEERRRAIIEPFLKMIGVDDRGPSGGR
jgi:hypothetical protein